MIGVLAAYAAPDYISIKTAKGYYSAGRTHVNANFIKLEVSNRPQAAIIAIRHGLDL
jgi:DNA-binding NarL/FixJ family response regulator